MINLQHKTLSMTLILASIISLSACSNNSPIGKVKGILADRGSINYQDNQKIKQLEIPPDLTQPEFDKSFELPTGIVSAVSLKNGTAMPSPTINSNVGVVRKGDLATIRTIAGKSVLQINDTYPRALILTEIMLTRMGFTTTNKSAAGDVITARYNGNDVTVSGKRKGFFSKAKGLVGLGGGNNNALTRGKTYRATIQNSEGIPIVKITPAVGIMSDAANTKVITLLNSAFNK